MLCTDDHVCYTDNNVYYADDHVCYTDNHVNYTDDHVCYADHRLCILTIVYKSRGK